MALHQSQFNGATLNAKASADVLPFRAVTVASAAEDFLTVSHATPSSVCFGFSTTDSPQGTPAGVAVNGIGLAVVNGGTTSIAAGDLLKVGTSDGVLVKASAGDVFAARALEAASSDGATIQVVILTGGQAAVLNAGKTIAGATGSLTQAEIDGRSFTLVSSNNGVLALAIPAANSVGAGTRLVVLKTGTAGAVTITPASGTINGAATYAAIDSANDRAEFIPVGNNWFILSSTIA
jgi:hypothetical protein